MQHHPPRHVVMHITRRHERDFCHSRQLLEAAQPRLIIVPAVQLGE